MGREFQLLEMGQVKFGWSKVKLGVSSHLVFTLQNPLARALTLDKSQHLGWATRSQEEPPARRAQPYVPSNFSYLITAPGCGVGGTALLSNFPFSVIANMSRLDLQRLPFYPIGSTPFLTRTIFLFLVLLTIS